MVNLNCTKSFLFDLKCTKIASGWGSAPDPAGGAYSAPPDPLAVRGGGEGRGGQGREGGGQGRGWQGRAGEGICDFAPLPKLPGYATGCMVMFSCQAEIMHSFKMHHNSW